MMFCTKNLANIGLVRMTSKSLVVPKQQLQLQLRMQGLRPMTILSKESAEEYKQKNYTQKMKNSGKPVSPHVLIYAFPIVAISSITTRVTGAALSVGCAGLGLLEIVGGTGSTLLVLQTIGSQGWIVASGAKFGLSFTLLYHYLAALRHFWWDYNPEMLTNVDVEKSSYMLLGGTTVLSATTMFV